MEDGEGASNVLDHFSEADEVRSLISALPSIYNELRSSEAGLERWTVIMDKYQEQPHLIDPFVPEYLLSLFLYIREPSTPPPLFHQSFKYIYLMTKMRGAKVIIRWFSHEVNDMEFVLSLLEAQNLADHESWESRYILLLWLSIIVIIPFDLARFDGSLTGSSRGRDSGRVADRIMDISKRYLNVPDKCQDSGAGLAARFISRPDQQREKLPEFIDWCLVTISRADKQSMPGMTALMGMLSALSTLFKCGKRDSLLPFAGTILKQLTEAGLAQHHNAKLRQLNTKLAQRLGLVFLAPKIAAWRYQRGNRSLLKNLNPNQFTGEQDTPAGVATAQKDEGGGEEGYDIPEETEEVVGMLLDALKDKDTIVRWSAAKGVGRITGRLPKDLGNEIVGSVLELCHALETDSAWHGACLALAELGRRGLLLPQRLHLVVPVIMQALVFDQKQGSNSVGAHVRDAGCYLCWSFARAYQPEVLTQYVQKIACGLLITTVFDREVNCRRAASAAFQEHVGRQGTFPHGIDIVTMADYFAVGNRTAAYLEISKHIGQFREYTHPLISHLVEHKTCHWDSAVRELAAQALNKMTELDPQYMRGKVLPAMLSHVMSSDVSLRHGSVAAVAELVEALSEQALAQSKSLAEYLGEEVISLLRGIPGRLAKADYIRGISGDVMRPVVLLYMQKMADCHLTFGEGPEATSNLETWQSILYENLANTVDAIRERAVVTFVSVCKEYYSRGDATRQAQETFIKTYLSDITTAIHFQRMGVSLALGSLPKPLLNGVLKMVISGLAKLASSIHDPDTTMTEARRDAVIALTRIVVTMPVRADGEVNAAVNAENLDTILDALLTAMRDYTTDSRGVVGTVVREAAMNGLNSILKTMLTQDPSMVTSLLVTQIFQNLVQQSNEKIDRTRGIACENILSLLHSTDPKVPFIPHQEGLLKLFDLEATAETNWKVPQATFPLTVALISMETYTYHALLGLVISVGGLTESTVQHSSSSLLVHLKPVSKDRQALEHFSSAVLDIFSKNPKESRVIVPLLKSLDIFLTNGVFDLWIDTTNDFPFSLLTATKEEILKSKDMNKLLASVSVFCGLLQFKGETKQKAFSQLMVFLCHTFPRLRRAAADQLYLTLLTFEDIVEDELAGHQVAAILTECIWEDPLEIVRPERNRMCVLLGVPQPVLKSKVAQKKKQEFKDDLASYKDLVDRAGY